MALTEKQHSILINWIDRYLIPIKTINPKVDTSDIRTSFIKTYKYGFYLDNYTLNDIMLELGYHASHYKAEPYLWFNVSSQSPALREFHKWASNPSIYEKYE